MLEVQQDSACTDQTVSSSRETLTLQNGDVAASALAEHTWSTGHHTDLSKAELVDTKPCATTQCLLESWHIQRHPDTLDHEKGTLPREYTALLGYIQLLTTYTLLTQESYINSAQNEGVISVKMSKSTVLTQQEWPERSQHASDKQQKM